MNNSYRCSLCGCTSLKEVLDLGQLPIIHRMPLLSTEVEETFPFLLEVCNDCGLIQNPNPIPPEILYTSFNFNFSSWKTEPHIANELDLIMSAGPYRTAFEIGSNDGRFLEELRNSGVPRLTGTDPNPVACQTARDRGFEVYQSMISTEICANARARYGEFDLVVSRQVIEHISDLDTYFSAIDSLLGENGYLFLDLPDMGPALRAGDCSVLWEEHVNYFTQPVLQRLLFTRGFEIVEFRKYDFSGGALAVLARKVSNPSKAEAPHTGWDELRPSIMTYGDRIRAYQTEIRSGLAKARLRGAAIVLFGTGVRGCMATNCLNLGDLIDYAVDDQCERQGRFTPGVKLEIRPSETLVEEKRPLVILLAVNNENEEKVVARVRQIARTEKTFVSLCSPRDIWSELSELA